MAIELLGRVAPPQLPQAELAANPETSGASIREALGVSVETITEARNEYAAATLWIEAIEARNVLVFQASRIPVREMRGLSLFEPILPVILLNGGDAVRGRVFTLLHELAHISFRAGGLCDLEGAPNSASGRVETTCNRTAAAALVPANDLRTVFQADAWNLTSVRSSASRYWVSPEVMLLRLHELKQVTEDQLERLQDELRRSQGKTTSKGGDYYRTFVRNNGYRFTSLLVDAFEGGRITPAEFVQYSGAKVNRVARIAAALQRREAAQVVVE